MKKNTVDTIMRAIASVVTAVGSDILERIEESSDAMEAKGRNNQLRNEWYSRFDSLPASYRITTFRNNMKVEFDTSTAVLICNKEGNNVYVATPFIDENGTKMYMVHDLYRVDEYPVPRNDMTILYRGSVENCWLRWYTFEKKNLG